MNQEIFEQTSHDHNKSASIERGSVHDKSAEKSNTKVLLGIKKVPTEASPAKDHKLEFRRNQKNTAIFLRPQTANVPNSKRYMKRQKSHRSDNSGGIGKI